MFKIESWRGPVAAAVFVLLLGRAALAESPAAGDIKALERRLEAIAAEFPGRVGLYALRLDDNREVAVNADDLFPMASVYKVPILVQLFRDAEAGKFSLDERYKLGETDERAGSGLLKFMRPGLQPTLYDLALLMITISDNEATDILLARVRPERVTATMRELGLNDIRVDRPTSQLIQDWIAKPDRRFLEDKRDVASPRAIGGLLAKIARSEAAGEDSCRQMLLILRQQQFATRIPRDLGGAPVAHKTGTLGFATNDAGLILARETGTIALAIFTLKDDLDAPSTQAEETIGRLARAVYDYFVYPAAGPE